MFVLALVTLVVLSFCNADAMPVKSYSGQHPCLASTTTSTTNSLKIDRMKVDIDYHFNVLFNTQSLSGSIRMQLIYSKPVTQPLMLFYSARDLYGMIDSVGSCFEIDSFHIYPDSSLLFFRDLPAAGAVDTLVIWFTNRFDYRGYQQHKSYYGIGPWCPIPVNIENKFRVELTARVPKGMVAVSAGEQLEKIALEQVTEIYSF